MRGGSPPLSRLLVVWLSIGLQSFGGGASTFMLIERVVVREQGWLTEAEYVRDVALAQVSPGINILGVTILIGRRLGGAWASSSRCSACCCRASRSRC